MSCVGRVDPELFDVLTWRVCVQSAANVILMDDDFCSIVNGIEEGRVLFDNLTKTIAYTLTHLVPELVAVCINILFSIPPGMSSLMILSIDLLSEVPPAISFAWEKSESNVMERPPRNRKTDRLVRPALLGERSSGLPPPSPCCTYGYVALRLQPTRTCRPA